MAAFGFFPFSSASEKYQGELSLPLLIGASPAHLVRQQYPVAASSQAVLEGCRVLMQEKFSTQPFYFREREGSVHSQLQVTKREKRTSYRIFRSLPFEKGSDAFTAVLASQFSPFDFATDIKLFSQHEETGFELYGSKEVRNLHTLGAEPLDRDPWSGFDLADVASSFAERQVRGDADSHLGNFGWVDSAHRRLISFDFDQCMKYQTRFSLRELERPGYIEPAFRWETPDFERTGNRPINHLERGLEDNQFVLPVGIWTDFDARIQPETTLTRRVLENSWLSSRVSLSFNHSAQNLLKKLEQDVSAKRAYFLHLALNTCIPGDWFHEIKKAHAPKGLPAFKQVFFNAKTRAHIEHLKFLQRALLTSTQFRKDFLENFHEYKAALEKEINRANRKYDKPLGHPKNELYQPLKINMTEALDHLEKLKDRAENPPDAPSALLVLNHSGSSDSSTAGAGSGADIMGADEALIAAYNDKILEILAYLNQSDALKKPLELGGRAAERLALSEHLKVLLKNLSAYLNSLSEIDPRLAAELFYFIRDLESQIQIALSLERLELERLEKNNFYLLINQLKKTIADKALVYYQLEPQRLLNRIQWILRKDKLNTQDWSELEREFLSLSLFVMNTVSHSITDQVPVMQRPIFDLISDPLSDPISHPISHPVAGVLRFEKVSPQDCGLSKQAMIYQGLAMIQDKVSRMPMDDLGAQFAYLDFVIRLKIFSVALSPEALEHLYHVIENKLHDPKLLHSIHGSVRDSAASLDRWFQAELVRHSVKTRHKKIEILLGLAEGRRLSDDQRQLLAKNLGFKILLCGCGQTDSLQCANALARVFENAVTAHATVHATVDSTLQAATISSVPPEKLKAQTDAQDLFRKILSRSNLSQAARGAYQSEFEGALRKTMATPC